MELEPFLFTSSVIGVVAQRLVRKVCTRCRVQEPLPASVRERFGITDAYATGYRGRGCDDCRSTGYRGRMAVFEVLVLNNAIKDAIHQRASAGEIRRLAGESGMISLRDDAALKIQIGLTTPEEALRAVYLEGE
jgi:type II secretory ATPase GspE/PulE/Tfp pilus assembly ATPase PilB-like protein